MTTPNSPPLDPSKALVFPGVVFVQFDTRGRRLNMLTRSRGGYAMDITVSEDVYQQLEEVKEWMESWREREVTFDEVILEILKQFEFVQHPEDLGSG
jgi:hypothetical protein